ncbi:MAG: hypothetical protein DHS20C06_08490 [Hyphobacterium sp.]|nr:MAG: hypothetical protein DHS20C06_08490 [Hyphobacterium sp.]
MRSRQVVWRLDLTPAIEPVNQAVISGQVRVKKKAAPPDGDRGSVRRCLQASKAGWGDAQGGPFLFRWRDYAITPNRVALSP